MKLVEPFCKGWGDPCTVVDWLWAYIGFGLAIALAILLIYVIIFLLWIGWEAFKNRGEFLK